MDHERYPLDWIPGFAESIRPHVHLRPDDNLLILPPNQAYKLNPTGTRLTLAALTGKDIAAMIDHAPNPESARIDTYHFFCDLRALVAGCLGEGHGRKAVEHVRYKPPFSSLPILSEIALTYRCNLACRFCYAGCTCRTKEKNLGEMDTATVKRVLDIIRNDADVPSVSFTGGEPTLRPDLPNLVAYARSKDMRVNLITNGTRIDSALASELADAGLNSAQVSIEGPNREVHEHLTAVPGSFERTLRGIDALVDAGIATQTNTTLNSGNVGHAVEIVDLIAERRLKRFAMNMLTPSGSASTNKDLLLSYSTIGDTVLAVKQRADEHSIRFFWYSPTPYCHFNPIVEGLGNKSCAACDGLLSIDPRGNVLPCSAFDEGVGNLLEEPFAGIWNSAQATFWRSKDYAPPQCNGCETFDACAAACPLYWDACGTAELDAPQEVAR